MLDSFVFNVMEEKEAEFKNCLVECGLCEQGCHGDSGGK